MNEQPCGKPLTLATDSLLCKWGFGDGDCLFDYVLDALDDDAYQVMSAADEDAYLACVVRRWLLPAVQAHHQVDVVFIGTCHNPLRVRAIDGMPYNDDTTLPTPDRLPNAPRSVAIPANEVRAYLIALASSKLPKASDIWTGRVPLPLGVVATIDP